MRALVVDDSRTARRLVRGMMQRLGFQVNEAENGLQALDTIEREGTPDIALVDWNMPTMDGMQFARAVRARPEFDSMLLMMVTTETEMERMAMAMEAGVNEYVMKPFDESAIEAKLQLLGIGVGDE